ncbi:DUF6471 domain-containing protein [Salinimonas iocasae]|uniref:DUF6471 domain-containing protein n=1 Tax=Salinimonas iocasae TaxID=2572577 RepID=A0A5B7YBJ7_9ALTE|nr:DUF6471 domain-containing protein [Salinimonas iocasae]QCZ92954.1 hypothetical protein FBQ74_05375 [Salinimonas iocasae]
MVIKLVEQTHWRQVVQRLIKSQMSIRGVKYQMLSDRLAGIGIIQSADNLRNKVNKGIMGADLLLAILMVLNAKGVDADNLAEILADLQTKDR